MPVAVASESATTILFTDIEDSSLLVEALGDRRWLDLLRVHNALIREQIALHRGFEVKTVGDGFMVAFASPDAAVACAAGIQRALAEFNEAAETPPLRVRIGLHTGTILREEDDFFGREVVMAARVSAAARGGEVLVSDAVRAAVGAQTRVGAPRLKGLKGLRGRHRLHPVLWDESAPDPEAPASARLLERTRELDALTEALGGAVTGAGRAVAVTGPPGIGKSALLAALVGRARGDGVRVLRAQGFQIEQAFPFGVARELIGTAAQRLDAQAQAALAPPAALRALGIEAAGEAPESPFALAAGLHRALLALTEGAPTLLVVDDAQWTDDATLEWLAFTARRLGNHPILLVLGVRDDGTPSPPALGELLAGGIAQLSPPPLTHDGTERIVLEREPTAAPEFVAACHAITAGVPLFVHELLTAARAAGIRPDRTGADGLTDVRTGSIEQLVRRRLDALGPDELALARACAVLDTRADLRSAGQVAGLAPAAALAAADALCAARLLEPRRPLQFVHPIMRAAVEAGLSGSERAALHATAAQLLIADGAPAVEVGAHLLAVTPGVLPNLVDRLMAAADDALADGAPRAGARFLERALDEPDSDGVAPALLTTLARAHVRLAESAHACALAERALAAGGDPAQRARALGVLARATELELLRPGSGAEWEPDGRRVIERVTAMVAELGPGDRALRFELEALALSLTTTHDAMLGIPGSPEALDRLEALVADATGETAGERSLCGHLAGYRTTTGTAPAARAIELARRGLDGTPDLDPELWTTTVEALMASDAHAEAEQHLGAIDRRARRLGSPAAAVYAAGYRGWNAWRAGALDEAEAFNHDTRALLRDTGPDEYLEVVCDAVMVGVHLARGHVDDARRVAAAIDHYGMRNHALGLVLAAEGDADGAVEHLTATRRRLDQRGLWRTTGPLRAVRPDLAIALVAAGDFDEARAVADAEEEVARRFGAASCLAEALRAQAAALGEAGSLREAAEVAKGCEARLVEAKVLVALGLATDGAESERALTRGLGIAERRGAAAIANRAREALAAR